MTASELAAKWNGQADELESGAKSYTRSCVEAKAAQLILLAKQLRACAKEVVKELGR